MKLTTQLFDKEGNPLKFSVVNEDGYQHTYKIIDSDGKQLGYVNISEERLGAPNYKKYIIINQLHNTSPARECRNVGTALHELVFRLSFSKRFQTNGNIKVDIGYESLLFHYHCGFRLHPRNRFEWNCLGNKFINHEQYGKAAYERWRLSRSDSSKPKSQEESSANDVLAFYYAMYKENKDQTSRAYLRENLAKLGGVLGYLAKEVIPQKKEEFSVDIAPISQSSSSSTFFYSTSQEVTTDCAIQHGNPPQRNTSLAG
ncbi:MULTISPECIES: hypothetical protein [unclassified Legionella]|uniref:hypothetical protein n=1 Tax=unclassified Legionella TaxID=2622702 RepID=UPI001E354AFB|nr:hypothetical protein [Legionella sp. 31fI33]MCC5016024.1 hypothetical protein [Legionella sp. 31fI33]